MVKRDTSHDPSSPPPPPPKMTHHDRTKPRRQSEGLTIILALAAGFAMGRMGEFTHWWQWVSALVVIGAFLYTFLRA